MGLILNIDTAVETASVSIAKDGVILAAVKNIVQKAHATFLHVAIKELLLQLSLELKKMDAIAVTKGPGSYTGLRVGMASAKGLCYAIGKPFITIGSLDAIALATIQERDENKTSNSLYCPMIDARRMEVYTAVFNIEMQEVLAPCAMILNNNSFSDILQNNNIYFSGSGALKWRTKTDSMHAFFLYEPDTNVAISHLSHQKFIKADFTDLTYSEPLYIKDFFSA